MSVAIVDTGIDANHPDLKANLRLIDGQTRGFDLYDNDPFPEDEWGHGTAVAGLLAAVTHNEKMMAGTARVSIIPVRAYRDHGTAGPKASSLASGIGWAVTQGADVILIASGIEAPQTQGVPVLALATKYAESAGTVVVAAAGNLGDTWGNSSVLYPARFPTVIAVGALTRTLTHASYSSYGPKIMITAPGGWGENAPSGENVISLYPTQLDPDGIGRDGYGTSFAAPLVAGTVALMLSASDTLDPPTVRAILNATARDLGEPGFDEVFGHGVVDPTAAVQAALYGM